MITDMPTAKRIEKMKGVVSGRQAGLIVVLEDLPDPHNAEAVFRSCEAFGVQEIYLIFDKEGRFKPRRVGKASSGSANKWLDFHVYGSAERCLKDVKKLGYTVVATTLREAENIFETGVLAAPKIALLFGNEKDGLSKKALECSDSRISIPMRGFVQSLNLSVTAAICLFEVTRRRTGNGEIPGLPERERRALLEKFSAK